MILELKLRKVGNSVGVVLPKEALAHLKVEEGDTLSVTEGPEGSLRVSKGVVPIELFGHADEQLDRL